MAACQSSEKVEPTRIPTRIPPTPTIRSTALPDVPKAPALGETEDRPIVIQFVLPDAAASSDARQHANDLQQALQDELELEIKVELVDEAAALKSLCGGAPVAAWVSPFTFVKAQSACNAVPTLAVSRGRSPRFTIGQTAEIIARSDVTDLGQLTGRVFCRSYERDDYFTSWVFPIFYIAAEGVNPVTGFSEIKDYPNDISLGKALYEGECTAAALPPDELEDLLIDLSAFLSTDENPVTSRELADVIRVVQPAADVALKTGAVNWQYPSGVIPYETFVFAPDSALPEALRGEITTIVEDFFNERETGSQRLNDLLDATGLISVSARSYEKFTPVVINARWDMTLAE
jgi:hypothetical protein